MATIHALLDDEMPYRAADEAFLTNLDNRESDALAYAIESLLWLKIQESAKPSWFKAIDPRFLAAVTFALDAVAKEPSQRQGLAAELVKLVAHWRNDLADAQVHPLYQLARVFDGDPGDFLELKGPVFLLTMDDVLEGIAHEYLNTVVGGASADYEYTVLLLCLLMLSVISEACFWATRGRGSHLETELARAMDSNGTAEALRGQLATLTLSGTALAWGETVEFINERSAEKIATPDFVLRRASASLFIECTTSKRKAPEPNDMDKVSAALAHAWREKRAKFARPEYQPGVVTVDLSGLPVDRGVGVHLRTDLVERRDLSIAAGRAVSIGISHARADFELMLHESQVRGMVAVAASALNSRFARDNRIVGIYAHYGQNIAVDARSQAVQRPIRGTLYWAGDPTGPEFELATRMAVPPVSNQVPSGQLPPVFVQLV